MPLFDKFLERGYDMRVVYLDMNNLKVHEDNVNTSCFNIGKVGDLMIIENKCIT